MHYRFGKKLVTSFILLCLLKSVDRDWNGAHTRLTHVPWECRTNRSPPMQHNVLRSRMSPQFSWFPLLPACRASCASSFLSPLAQGYPQSGPLCLPTYQSTSPSQTSPDSTVSLSRLIFLRVVWIPSLTGFPAYLRYVSHIAFPCGLNLFICFIPNMLRKLHVTEAYTTTRERLSLLTQSGRPNHMSQPYIWLQET